MTATNIGDILREERESKKLTLEDVSEKTKISLEALRQIENNVFDEKLSTFTNGHIRLYCEAIELELGKIITNEKKEEISDVENTEIEDETEAQNNNAVYYTSALVIIGAVTFYLFTLSSPVSMEPAIASSPISSEKISTPLIEPQNPKEQSIEN